MVVISSAGGNELPLQALLLLFDLGITHYLTGSKNLSYDYNLLRVKNLLIKIWRQLHVLRSIKNVLDYLFSPAHRGSFYSGCVFSF